MSEFALCERNGEPKDHKTHSKRLLTCVPDLQLDALAVELDVFDLEIDSDCCDECWRKRLAGVAKQQARLAHAAVANHKQLDLQVKRIPAHGCEYSGSPP